LRGEKMSVKKCFGLCMVCLFVLMTTGKGLAEDWSRKYPIKKDISGPYSYDSISKKDYKGITLNIITHVKPVIGEPTEVHARQFEELTGAKIIVKHVPFGKLYQEIMLGLRKGKYDVLVSTTLWLADMYSYLEPLPQKMLDSDQFKDVIQYYKDLSRRGDSYYFVPIDGDRHYMQYRRDLLENPSWQSEFKSRYHKPLEAPKTWIDLMEISEFFNNKDLGNGKTVYGMAEITKKDDLLYSHFIKRAAPYAKHPDVKGGFYFDLKTMKPLINNPGFVEALENFIKMHKFYPPGGENWGLWDIIQSFGKGQVVFSDSWDDAFIQAMEPESGIRNQVAAGISPGARKVWNRDTGKWNDFPDVNYAPYIASGWTSSVAKSSQHKEAAFDFLGFFGNEANHASDLLIGRYGVNPFRYSDLDKNFWTTFAGWDENVAFSYIQTFSNINKNKNKLFDLRIHLAGLYMNALNTGVARALTGRATAQEALDGVAREWEKLNKRVGIDKQREVYANLVRLEDNE
ncbi:extracellular solute-binding protein, partial [Desulfobacterales bacterium HSG17]|nr:extracellular solute-binding protein [Desulfobacterales bacterium HSG17]